MELRTTAKRGPKPKPDTSATYPVRFYASSRGWPALVKLQTIAPMEQTPFGALKVVFTRSRGRLTDTPPASKKALEGCLKIETASARKRH